MYFIENFSQIIAPLILMLKIIKINSLAIELVPISRGRIFNEIRKNKVVKAKFGVQTPKFKSKNLINSSLLKI